MATYSIADFGAKADGVSDNAPAIQAAIDKYSGSGGGRVVVPSGGIHLSGAFALKSHVDLHLTGFRGVGARPGVPPLSLTDVNE